MVAIGEVSAALSGIKVSFDMLKNAVSLKSDTKINEAVIEIQKALLTAQSAAFEDRERLAAQQVRIAELEAKLSEIDRWEKDKARYQLTETATGALVYALKQNCANGDPDHKLCVKCFNEDRKSVLQVVSRHGGGERVKCLHCNVKQELSPFPKVVNDMGYSIPSWIE
jgi:hypothetical protein